MGDTEGDVKIRTMRYMDDTEYSVKYGLCGIWAILRATQKYRLWRMDDTEGDKNRNQRILREQI